MLYVINIQSSYEPVPRKEFLEQIYAHVHPTDLGTRDIMSIHPHRLSVLFMICAISTLLDTSRDSPISEADDWHNLAKASVALHSITDEPTIMGVQTLVRCFFTPQRDIDEGVVSF